MNSRGYVGFCDLVAQAAETPTARFLREHAPSLATPADGMTSPYVLMPWWVWNLCSFVPGELALAVIRMFKAQPETFAACEAVWAMTCSLSEQRVGAAWRQLALTLAEENTP